MSEAFLQFLLLLGYLIIGLISITFPIYAISVTYLQQELRESEKERKKRVEILKGRLAQLTEELSGEKADSERFKQMEKERKECKTELDKLDLRVGRLRAGGAVGFPVFALCVGLLLLVLAYIFSMKESSG